MKELKIQLSGRILVKKEYICAIKKRWFIASVNMVVLLPFCFAFKYVSMKFVYFCSRKIRDYEREGKQD